MQKGKRNSGYLHFSGVSFLTGVSLWFNWVGILDARNSRYWVKILYRRVQSTATKKNISEHK